MRVMFLTQEYPMNKKNGAQNYSSSIIESLIRVGCVVDVIVLRDCSKNHPEVFDGANFIFGSGSISVLNNASKLPRMVSACISDINIKIIKDINKYCNIVIFDHFASTGYFYELKGKKIYISHNDEERSKRSFIGMIDSFYLRLAHYLDLIKISRWQKNITRDSDACSFISEVEYIKSGRGERNILLEPISRVAKYVNNEVKDEIIAIVGTFIWTPKRIALRKLVEKFLTINKKNIKLIVAGSFLDADYEEFKNLSPKISCIKNFDEVDDILKNVRIGLMVDGAGGGFKMKFLDYVRNSCAVYSLRTDVASSLMVDGRNCRIFNEIDDLLISAINDCEDIKLINVINDNAKKDFKYFFSENRFDEQISLLLNGGK